VPELAEAIRRTNQTLDRLSETVSRDYAEIVSLREEFNESIECNKPDSAGRDAIRLFKLNEFTVLERRVDLLSQMAADTCRQVRIMRYGEMPERFPLVSGMAYMLKGGMIRRNDWVKGARGIFLRGPEVVLCITTDRPPSEGSWRLDRYYFSRDDWEEANWETAEMPEGVPQD